MKHIGKTWGTSTNINYVRNKDGSWSSNNGSNDDEDTRKLELLGDKKRTTSYVCGSYETSHASSSNRQVIPTKDTSKSSISKDDEIKLDTVKYIADRYESHILATREGLIGDLKQFCENNNIDYAPIGEIIHSNFSNDIKF